MGIARDRGITIAEITVHRFRFLFRFSESYSSQDGCGFSFRIAYGDLTYDKFAANAINSDFN